MIRNFKIGSDIEVFLKDRNTNKIVTAEGIIKGTKHEPFRFDDENHYYATSLDNVMAEFCIPPATTNAEFYFAIEKALKYINNNIPKHLETIAIPAAFIDEEHLMTANAMLFGCDPDFNAWTEQINTPPGTGTQLRTCGAHIHIGYDEPNEFANLSLIKAMDLFIGVPSVIIEPENERKTMYGKAGSFRHKEYGVEFRSISNYYLQSKELIEWIFNNTLSAIDFVNKGGCNGFGAEEKEEIVNCINYNDKNMANFLIGKYNIKMVA